MEEVNRHSLLFPCTNRPGALSSSSPPPLLQHASQREAWIPLWTRHTPCAIALGETLIILPSTVFTTAIGTFALEQCCLVALLLIQRNSRVVCYNLFPCVVSIWSFFFSLCRYLLCNFTTLSQMVISLLDNSTFRYFDWSINKYKYIAITSIG